MKIAAPTYVQTDTSDTNTNPDPELHDYLCLMPSENVTAAQSRSAQVEQEDHEEVDPAVGWAALSHLEGKCLYLRQGWFTYSYVCKVSDSGMRSGRTLLISALGIATIHISVNSELHRMRTRILLEVSTRRRIQITRRTHLDRLLDLKLLGGVKRHQAHTDRTRTSTVTPKATSKGRSTRPRQTLQHRSIA